MKTVDPIQEQLTAQRKTVVKNRQMEAFWDRLTSSVGQAARFQELLQEFGKQFPLEPQGVEFARVAMGEPDLWEAMEGWSELAATFAGQDLTELSPEQAAALAKTIRDFRAAHPRFPDLAPAQRLTGYFQRIAQRRDAAGERIHRSLNEMLNSPTMARLSMLRVRNGKSYYFVSEKPMEARESIIVHFVTGFGLDRTQSVTVKKTDIANPSLEDTYNWTSPQMKFSRYALERLAQLDDKNWETTFGDILVRLCAAQDLDPIVRVQLLQRFLEIACQGSQCFKEVYQQILDLVVNSGVVGSVNWLDPEDADANRAREQAERTLAKFGDCEQYNRRVQSAIVEIRNQRLGCQYHWIGWLQKTRTGSWTCVLPPKMPLVGAGELVVLDVPPKDGRTALRTIGSVRDGKASIVDNASAYLQGRAVFVAEEVVAAR